jgi:integrase
LRIDAFLCYSLRMAKQRKNPSFIHCKIVRTSHPSAPWRVSYPTEIDGVTRRKRRTFSTEDKALAFAAGHERDVVEHGIRFGSITSEARRAFDFYRDARADLEGAEIEVPSFEKLVMDAVTALRKNHADRQRSRMPIAEAVAEFLAYKGSRVGCKHRNALKGQLGRFAKTFGTDFMDAIGGAEIESWIQSVEEIGPVSRNKLRKSLKSLFAFGVHPAQGWSTLNPLAHVEREKVVTSEPEAYTPEETAKIMQAALEMNSPVLPCLALGFFAGLRPSESMMIDLSVIDFEADEFRVPANSKTGARSAPLTAACRAWLASQARRTGTAWQSYHQAYATAVREILAAAGVTGIYDGARHSFITYRTAETRDVARVADECGNSPNIIKKHYRNIVPAVAAKKYFDIRPEDPAQNVTSIQSGRAIA